ncbi:MAG TPA: glycosyltransferase [Actinomycetota bacterium]|nr:glycosyltransferase [Actinomycetota bacterium]
MKGGRIQQFLPSLGFRDAVGTHTLCTQDALSSAGGGIWAEDIHPQLLRRARTWSDYAGTRSARRGRDVLLYQASTGSRGLAPFLTERPETKAIYYHNITPAEFFEPFDPGAAINLSRAREELSELAPRCAVAMANSEYSASELHELGIEDVSVIPPYLPPSLDAAPDPHQLDWLRRTKRGLDLLFVSRVAPHKGHADLLRVLATVRAAIDPNARLFVVGAWGPDPYMRMLFKLRERLRLEGVVFCGSITEPHLAAYYAGCDVFISMSRHEGFGLPLLEAMRAGLPVIAYDGGAVGETLGGSGVLVRTRDPATIAEVVHRVGCDESLRASVVARQRARVAELGSASRDARIREALLPLLGS